MKLQSLQTYGAYDVKSFSDNGESFLAVAIGGMKILPTSTRSFISGIAAGLFGSSPFPLTQHAHGNHSRFAVKRSWLLPTSTGSQLCIVCPDHSLSNTRSFQLNMHLTLKRLNTKVTLTWQLQIMGTPTVLCTNWYTNRQKTLNKPRKLTLGIHHATTIVTNTESTVTLSKVQRLRGVLLSTLTFIRFSYLIKQDETFCLFVKIFRE